jgi:hypothetical protein
MIVRTASASPPPETVDAQYDDQVFICFLIILHMSLYYGKMTIRLFALWKSMIDSSTPFVSILTIEKLILLDL